jgi:hypothetical protein
MSVKVKGELLVRIKTFFPSIYSTNYWYFQVKFGELNLSV